MVTLSERMAAYAVGLKYDDLPANVVHAAKRLLLDTLGCAIFGFECEPTNIVKSLIADLRLPHEASVIGSGQRTSLAYASLANGVMVRFSEFNDTYVGRSTLHPSEAIPTALALGEFTKATGKDVLAAIVLGHEVNARVGDLASLNARGLHHTSIGIVAVPIVAGKLLGLNEEQMTNAIGISASYGLTIDECHEGSQSMMRSIAYGFAAQSGILAAQLAQRGFTGPRTVFEGSAGFLRQLGLKGEEAGVLLDERFRIFDVAIKYFACSTASQSAVSAASRLARAHQIAPADVEAVNIRTFRTAFRVGGDPQRRFPESKESADHSMYYNVAVALLEGTLGPEQYTDEKVRDPEVHRMIERINIVHDPTLDNIGPRAMPTVVEIVTKQGRRYETRVDHPKGYAADPLTDEEVKSKFRGLASRVTTPARIAEIIEIVFNLDRARDVSELMSLLRFI